MTEFSEHVDAKILCMAAQLPDMIALGLSTEVVNVWMNDPGFGAHKVTSLPHGAAVLAIATFGPYIA